LKEFAAKTLGHSPAPGWSAGMSLIGSRN
jgi:hypothetical protein